MLPRSWIDALFSKFESYYGQSFIDKWKHTNIEATKDEWAEGLARFDGDILKAALFLCREGSPRPPTLPEFIGFCKSARPAPEHRPFLPHKFEKSERADEFIAKMKLMLKKADA